MKDLCSGKSGKLNITILAFEESNPKAEMDFLKALVSGLAESFIIDKGVDSKEKKNNEKEETIN